MKETMKDNPLKEKKESRRAMLERAKQMAQQKSTDPDLASSTAAPPRSDDRELYAGMKDDPHS